MNGHGNILFLVLAAIAGVAMIFVVRARRNSHRTHIVELAGEEVCDHLRPALETLRERGHVITRVGMVARDMPLEIHFSPAFDPKALLEELKLVEPVFLSERNVLYCKEDWCELHPKP